MQEPGATSTPARRAPTHATYEDAALELSGVSKAFVGVQALSDISLACRTGEIHALVGENGAGKSTLIKVASGALRPDTGAVRIGGRQIARASTLEARRMGLLTAYQDTSLVTELTVAENVLLSFHGVRKLPLRRDITAAARLLEQYQLPFGSANRVSELSPASRQLLEVTRCLIHRPHVLLLDEPTAALDVDSTHRLETLLHAAKEHTAILYISHRLDEIRRLADRVTVLRDGRLQGQWQGAGWSIDEVIRAMVGVPTELAFPAKGTPHERVVVSTRGFSGQRFGPVDIDVRAGEIVGIAGSEGNGQRELLRALAGLRRARGKLLIDDQPIAVPTPAAALRNGISFLSGDRAAESIFAELSVMDNATLALGSELGPLGSVMRGRERRAFEPVARDLGIAHASPDQPVGMLSGGNQQKVVMARGILRPTKLLVVDEPTQGVDVNARLDLYRVLAAEAAAGTAVLISSSDSAELEGLCNRVYVLSRGRVVRELEGNSVNERTIVSSFVDVARREDEASTTEGTLDRDGARRLAVLRDRLSASASALPLLVLLVLMFALGIYAQSESDSVFLSSSNLNSLFVVATPLVVVAMGQLVALLSAEFDIAVGSTMSLTVVVLSVLATGDSLVSSVPGVLAVLAMGVVIGLAHAFIVRGLKVNAIIATIATLGIIQGIAIVIRPEPDGLISLGLTDLLSNQVGVFPVVFLVAVAVAVLADAWRVGTNGGLTVRATGLTEEPSRRTGARVGAIKVTAYVLCSVAAVFAGILLAVQVGVGSNSVGAGYPLLAFTACFLGGAALTGGKGSFVGTLLGAIFLTMLVNVTPLVNVNDAVAQTLTGVLTVLAVAAYSYRPGTKRAGDGGGAPPRVTHAACADGTAVEGRVS